MKITFIGGGNMAGAMIGGVIRHGWSPLQITVVEIDALRQQQLSEQYGILATASLPDGVHDSEVVILAVKPQQLHDVVSQSVQFFQNRLVISIAAGVRASDLSQWLDQHEFIIRAMPNTPALIGEGVTGLYAMPQVDIRQKEQAASILKAIGTIIWVDEELQLDAVTALSGSGPAYVFYFLEAMQEAGVELGLTADMAKQLAMQTFLGATHLAAQNADPLALLRMKVTSKGGTTEQALLSMEQADIKGSFIRAMHAAHDRSRQMGEILGRA
ncbi:pyrroline-5-carboxylate reductase [Betaproteobacteria bacterium PRO4]|uniref:pyrroline-5-carboxylate reductase n=1 Tax=Nitrosomonas sp. TaxID=42353 RepID=UPI00256E6B6F|nr:pyrroline-5-carboxylate reductase [Nitrosomonas sp.]MBE7526535.1 pyrroline-5-carboxylate reductase [Burkholderiales bacterium]MDL1866466.1 pyrroline-5-carboxylate reductase [Betaproteobacteria bacterium PRO4]